MNDTIMNNSMIRGFVIIFGFLAIGEMIVSVTGIKFPASIIGMLLLTASLKLGWVKVHWVKSISSILIGNLSFFFVAPGVAIMLYLGLIKQNFLSIIVASIVSTAIVLAATGWAHQFVSKLIKASNKSSKTGENE